MRHPGKIHLRTFIDAFAVCIVTSSCRNHRAYVRAECHGDLETTCLTATIFSGVWTLQGLLSNFLFKTESISVKFPTNNIMIWFGFFV